MASSPEDYIARGWKIFPCHAVILGKCTCGKPDCKAPGKHPRTPNGHKDATTDLAVIRNWWTTWPQANIAVATGEGSGIWVVDVDPRHGGYESLNEFESDRPDGTLPRTLTAVTGGSGRHLFFRYPDDGSRVPTRNPWRPGIEIKSDGGYVILTPGTHISGGRYSWQDEHAEVISAPRDLLESIREVGSGSSGREELPSTSDILAGIPEGKRDDHLFRAACRLRRQLGDKERPLIEKIIGDAAANAVPPFDHDEAMRKVEQAFRQDHTDDDDTVWGYLTPEGERLPGLTDVGNKNRFVNAYENDFRYVIGIGWMQWTDTGWTEIEAEEVLFKAESVSEIIKLEMVNKVTDATYQLKYKRHAAASESGGAISAIERLARNDPRLRRNAKEFDVNGLELGCSNGVVDLRTGTIREFGREDLITKNTGVVYEPYAQSDVWEKFLWTATQSDPEMIRYLQLAAGYTLTGNTNEEAFFVLTGPTASGKSTFLDAILGVMGSYGETTQSETFMYKRGKDTARDELASFLGKRMIGMSEIREGEGFNESLIKQFTGGDMVKAKFLYQNPFSFKPQFKLWIATNHDPASQDDALMRRIKRIPFTHTIPAHLRDPSLKAHVKNKDTGAKAVLAWAVRGAVDYLKLGSLNEPDKVKLAVHTYATEHDTFSQFIDECYRRVPESSVHMREVYSVYSMWAKANNEYPVKRPQFRQRMTDRGFRPNGESFPGLEAKQMNVSADGIYWS